MNILQIRKTGLLFATNNPNKILELERYLEPYSIPVYSLKDLKIDLKIEETGKTFQENAALKALCYYRLANIPTLADDSGLEVDILNKEPGVLSARYGNVNFTDQERNEYLLKKMLNVAPYLRTARFICVFAFIEDENQSIRFYEGKVEGKILFSPRGTNGFGYDPIFEEIRTKKSFAELTIEEKNEISHRGQALKEFVKDLIKNS
ncbi:MAG: RdgB/HAM1 family non-canonical purine NTP pyrophosphatase [Leptonema sp. (in: bacteria)]